MQAETMLVNANHAGERVLDAGPCEAAGVIATYFDLYEGQHNNAVLRLHHCRWRLKRFIP